MQRKAKGPTHASWKIIDNQMGSTAKTEITSAHYNAQEATPTRNMLHLCN